MPVSPTYPGVYLSRLPSGVRAITGVSTSVTAFIGEAARGQIGVAKRILNFSDFDRNYGGLVAKYDLGYAVRQFFVNGGSQAWIIRVAANPVNATLDLKAADGTTTVLTITALDAGDFGNTINVNVDWNTAFPDSTFNLTLTPRANPASAESFAGLSMNSQDSKYVEKVMASSQLVSATRASGLTFTGLSGVSRSGDFGGDPQSVLTAPAGQPARTDFRVVIDGLPAIRVSIASGDFTGASAADRLTNLALAITSKVSTSSNLPAIHNFTCQASGNLLELRSGTLGETSTVRVLPGASNDASVFLKLGVANGGSEIDAAALYRPTPIPDPGSLTGAALAASALDGLPAANTQAIQITLDGGVAETIDIGAYTPPGSPGDLLTKLQGVAQQIQTIVQSRRNTAAYKKFTATVAPSNTALVLQSGTRGAGSSVQVLAAPLSGGGSDALAGTLGLLAGSTAVAGKDSPLVGGSTQDITDATTYSSYVPAGGGRQGIYALEEVDIFNLMALPGITDPATLADSSAYCEKRRAFLIIDSAFDTDVSHMATKSSGPSLPKSINAAVYFPYIKIADPLNGGQAKLMPPSGAIAGVYARTDSARGVWKAPAGTDASIVGAIGIQYTLTDDENGVLNPLGVNCIRNFPIFSIVSWGARTLRGSDEEANEYKYIPVERTALFLEESLYRGLKWVVFEPNDEPLWASIRLNVGAFLQGLFRQGAFAGRSARDAFFVKCDSETTTPTDQALGRVNIIVGFAPLRPAEFVIVQLQQIAGQAAA